MAGLSDIHHDLCLALALWNGRDPILKERMFGLTGPEGNHGEDAKEYWWYHDALPSHALLRWRYHYPQAEFPYGRLVEENRRRGKDDPEFELLDTGVFDDGRYWAVDVTYAKRRPPTCSCVCRSRTTGPRPPGCRRRPLPTAPRLGRCSARTRRTWPASSAPRPRRRSPRTGSATTWWPGRRR